jgi:hypothetical protein
MSNRSLDLIVEERVRVGERPLGPLVSPSPWNLGTVYL